MVRALAPRVRMMTGVDITEGMLEEARKNASEEKLQNVRFEKGDADNLKFMDEVLLCLF